MNFFLSIIEHPWIAIGIFFLVILLGGILEYHKTIEEDAKLEEIRQQKIAERLAIEKKRIDDENRTIAAQEALIAMHRQGINVANAIEHNHIHREVVDFIKCDYCEREFNSVKDVCTWCGAGRVAK